MRDKYSTKQKNAIREFLKTLDSGHITAKEVSQHFEKASTPISTSTVYRHLETMVLDGSVRKYTIDSHSPACYQYVDCKSSLPHFHFKCKQCGTLLHVECSSLAELKEHILSEHNFSIDVCGTVFVGLCSSCTHSSDFKE